MNFPAPVITRGAAGAENVSQWRAPAWLCVCTVRGMLRVVLSASLVVSLLVASDAAPRSLGSDGRDAGLELPAAVDINPDPRVTEINLEARIARVQIGEGQTVDAWTYDGGVPGPLIRLHVGDRLIVHFTNRLPEPTTVHWHGLRIPLRMDGVPGISQPPVNPGESFTYDFVVPDAGLFWYHPHVMSAAQVGFGLYGALLVDDPGDGVGVADEAVMVLSDMALNDRGALESPKAGGSIADVFGREGTRVLLNGHTRSSLLVRSGAPQRWRIVNAAKSRYFNLDLGGAMFRQIGGDGGLQEYAVERDTLLLAPGERADVIVTPRLEAGESIVLRSVIVNRGLFTFEGRFPYDELLTLTGAAVAPQSGPAPMPVRRTIEPLPLGGATNVDLELAIDQPPDAAAEYAIRGRLYSARHKALPARVGETQIWTVTNSTKWSHPLHLHGFFFQVLDDSGAPVRPLAWKDTVDIPFEKTVRLAVRFDDREGVTGAWMLHCHILDHAEGGLMGVVQVGPANADAGSAAFDVAQARKAGHGAH
jgi:FtsP/CotA-like multicopper oxidase with cupredoxin domain